MQLRKMLTIVRYTPLYMRPSYASTSLCDLLDGTIVFYNNDEKIKVGDTLWAEIMYRTNSKNIIGWIPNCFVEPFVPSLLGYDIIRVKSSTPSDSDYAQNIIYKGNVQFNLCGEFSVLYCAQYTDEEFAIEDWLDEWAIKSPSFFNRIFYGGKSKTTGISDLTNMFQTFEGYKASFDLISSRMNYNGKYLFTPYKVMDLLVNNRMIVGCKIESRFGRLSRTGIPHWVVIERVMPEARGGIVNLYNPASNSVETYSWEEFVASTSKAPYGIIVPR